MLSSVFNRRKVQQRLNNLTNTRRTQSPPSPASFVSPEIVEINDKLGLEALHSHQASESSLSLNHASPQVQLNLRRSESISDWFPPDMLRSEPIAPPERGASLAAGSLGSTNGVLHAAAARDRSGSNATERLNISRDEIIIIEAEPRGENEEEETLGESSERGSTPDPAPTPPRKAAPAPIIIPDNLASSKVTLQRSASGSGINGVSSGGLSRVPSRIESIYSDDGGSSAVSGMTLARALVGTSSFIVSNERQSHYRSHGVTRQDSATLPKGEHPWRLLASPVPPVPPMPTSAELAIAMDSAGSGRSRRNSSSVAEARRQSEARLNGLIPDAAAASSSAGSLKRPRPRSLTRMQQEQYVGHRISRISEGASPQPSPLTPAVNLNGSPTTLGSHVSGISSSTGKHHSGVSTSSEGLVASSSTSLQNDDSSSSTRKHHSGVSAHSDSQAYSNAESSSGSTASPHVNSADPDSEPPQTASTSSVYSPNSMDTLSPGSTAASSVLSPGSSIMGVISPSSFAIHRSRSDRGSSREAPHRPMILVPVGERPHSVPVSASPLSSRESIEAHRPFRPQPAVPMTARLPGDSPMDSPDLLDFMIPRSALIAPMSIRRSGSHLPPITVPTGDEDVLSPEHSFSTDSPSSESAARQTFPETPYAFTPLISAGFASQIPANQSRASPRMKSLYSRGISRGRSPLPPSNLLRSVTSAGHRPTGKTDDLEPDGAISPPASLLSAIEEKSMPPTPISQIGSSAASSERSEMRSVSSPEARPPTSPGSRYTVGSPDALSDGSSSSASPLPQASSPEATSEHSQSRRSSARDTLSPDPSQTTNTVPIRRSLTPSPSPLSPVKDLPPPSPRQSSTSDINSILTSSPRNSVDQTTLPSYHAEPGAIQQDPQALPPPYRDSVQETKSVKRMTSRTRPHPPTGPRRPSAPTMLLAANRARNGSVTSLHSNSASSSRQATMSFSASTPRFQTTPIKFRGLTLEQAQWTLSQSELQTSVSKSIKQWADPASIRLLHPEVLENKIGDDRQRLEVQSSELRTSYKLAVRKRRALMSAMSSAVDSGEIHDQAALTRTMEELKELNENMDRISEELYCVTDQLSQLRHLEDVHNSSALGMALRKLNASFIKHMQDNSLLRQRITDLEAERDEGWEKAQEVAQELEARDPSSRRASKVSMARKSSMRASKAGLRSPSRHRSQRSSGQSSLRNSGAPSPAVRSAYDDIPPVPPIPIRKSLGIVTTDLPMRSAGLTSEMTPTSETRALADAQRELCEMLGISLEELQLGGPPKRRVSTSDVGMMSPGVGHTRRNSEVMTPARTKDEQRAAVLASIGMMSHEI